MHNVDFKSEYKPYIIYEMFPMLSKRISNKYHIYAHCRL